MVGGSVQPNPGWCTAIVSKSVSELVLATPSLATTTRWQLYRVFSIPPGPYQRTPAMSWSLTHLAVEQEDLARLRDLLDAGHDVEDDHDHGWTLLRHAVDVEHDSHVQTGAPLHADVTAFLLARGADPLRLYNGVPVVEEAEIRGHWLAAEIMRGWIRQGQDQA